MTTEEQINPGNTPDHWRDLYDMWQREGTFDVRAAEMRQAWEILAKHIPARGAFLEVGCGPGMFIEFLRARTHIVSESTWAGVDLSGLAISVAQERIPEGEFHVVNVAEQPLPWPDETFDTVFTGHLIEHLTDPTRMFLPEIRRVAKREALIVIEFPHGDLPYPEHVHDDLDYEKVTAWLDASGLWAEWCLPVLDMRPTNDGVILARRTW